MAEFTEEFYYEHPEGYEPEEYAEPEVRSLEELRADLKTDPETWKAELIATLTEIYLPAGEVYEQEEIKRKFAYRIEDPEDNSPFTKEELKDELEMITEVFDEDRMRAKEIIDSVYEEEVSEHILSGFRILESSADYTPAADEDLLAGYEPAVEDGSVSHRVYESTEDLRKLVFKINRLDEDEDLADMNAPFEIVEGIGEDCLKPEDREKIAMDKEHKKDLNRRFEKKRELQGELISLTESILDDEEFWQDVDDEDREEDWYIIDDLRHEIANDMAAYAGA